MGILAAMGIMRGGSKSTSKGTKIPESEENEEIPKPAEPQHTDDQDAA